MLHQQGGLEGVGMVVVDLGPLFEGQVGVVVVVGIVMDDLDGLAGAGFPHAQGHGGLAGARAAGDPDDHRREWFAIPVLSWRKNTRQTGRLSINW